MDSVYKMILGIVLGIVLVIFNTYLLDSSNNYALVLIGILYIFYANYKTKASTIVTYKNIMFDVSDVSFIGYVSSKDMLTIQYKTGSYTNVPMVYEEFKEIKDIYLKRVNDV